MRFFVLDDLAMESRLVHVRYLLQHFFAVFSHFLADDAAHVDVVFREFFCAAELDVLVHELGDEVTRIHQLIYVVGHDSVLIGCGLKVVNRARSITTHTAVIVTIDLVYFATKRQFLKE